MSLSLLPDLELSAKQQFATLIANHFDRFSTIYDFGCGDGYFLSEITKWVVGRATGLDPAKVIGFKYYPWILHPIDIASPVHLGPAGNVLSVAAAENLPKERLPSLFENIQRHCKSKLVLVWSTPSPSPTGLIGITPKRPQEVVPFVEKFKFKYHENLSEQWQDTVADELWWGRKRIYIFDKSNG